MYFPFGQDQASYEAQRDAKTKGVPEGALAALDALQPYRGGNDWLWSLHQLDIIDKHRLLLTIIVSHNSVVIDMGAIMRHLAPADSPGAEAPSMPIALAPSDSELAGPQPLVFTAPIGDVSHDHVRIVTQVALGDPEQLRGQPLRPSLWAMHAQVVHAIESFRPFL